MKRMLHAHYRKETLNVLMRVPGAVTSMKHVNPALALSFISGLSATLLAYAIVYVRGDAAGIMHFLRERGQFKRLVAAGAAPEQVDQARTHLVQLAEQLAAPQLAVQLIPLEVLAGVLVGVLVWWVFQRRTSRIESGRERLDVQERMVLRFAHRMGGTFTLRDLTELSPLRGEQARLTVTHLLEHGHLRRDGERYTLP